VLGGYPPFDFTADTLYDDIKEGNFEFDEEFWGSMSPEAVDFVKRMLCVDQKARWTAEQLLKHPWLLSSNKEMISV
jgi:serine/threonine protein kinase